MKRMSRPDIILIITDQQNHSMMSCAGNRSVSTPSIDDLAAKGARFDRAYCTNPLCMPSRFSIMTGRMPSDIGLRGNSADFNWSMLDDIKKQGFGWCLRDSGYETVYGGKVHLPAISPDNLGFDYISNDERAVLARKCADFVLDKRDKPYVMIVSLINPHDISFMSILEYGDDVMIERFMKQEQFKAAIETYKALGSIPEGISSQQFYDFHAPPLPENFDIQEDEPEIIKEMLSMADYLKRPRIEYDENKWRLYRWAYKRLTEDVDSHIGIITDALKKSGREEDTVVILTSDHGDMNASHQLQHKTLFYDEASRIPLIISQKGSTKADNSNSVDLVSNGLDIIPTIFDYAGIDLPYELCGKSLKNAAAGREGECFRDHVMIENEYGNAVVTHGFKYALYNRGKGKEQLQDLVKDPGEMRNFAKEPEYREVVANMRRLYAKTYGGGI